MKTIKDIPVATKTVNILVGGCGEYVSVYDLRKLAIERVRELIKKIDEENKKPFENQNQIYKVTLTVTSGELQDLFNLTEQDIKEGK